jgi:hypothetical protein
MLTSWNHRSAKPLLSQQYAHIIGNGRGFTSKAYPMERNEESMYAPDDFVNRLGFLRRYFPTMMQPCKDGASGVNGFKSI